MKLTGVLYKQHIGRQLKKLWYVKRERKVNDTKTEGQLLKLGIEVKDPLEMISPKREFSKLKVEFLKPRPIVFDETHPDWKAKACLVFKDNNVLQEGFRQAQTLTNTVCLSNSSSNYIQDLFPDLPEHIIKYCNILILHSTLFINNLDKESDLIQFTLSSDVTVMSANPLKPIENSNSNMEIDIPNMQPLHYTQIFSRTLIKTYTMAASCARQKFGSSVKKLPEPVTVQCIQSDGKNYHFFIFQLNSLDANDVSVKNFWCPLPPLTLYEKAEYDNGRPVVEGYNPEVFRRILALYRNGS
ncbi:RM37 protein, partial [Acromyrmex heyeri]